MAPSSQAATCGQVIGRGEHVGGVEPVQHAGAPGGGYGQQFRSGPQFSQRLGHRVLALEALARVLEDGVPGLAHRLGVGLADHLGEPHRGVPGVVDGERVLVVEPLGGLGHAVLDRLGNGPAQAAQRVGEQDARLVGADERGVDESPGVGGRAQLRRQAGDDELRGHGQGERAQPVLLAAPEEERTHPVLVGGERAGEKGEPVARLVGPWIGEGARGQQEQFFSAGVERDGLRYGHRPSSPDR
ncbi:hypothetical protein ACFWY5_14980 [Nonomuraea sp. NPDC059007]|uniref:hypothetical protein n=1 Tax=Nonomuraea sp. NPDC059007 TaxID=3346692 RepID=UPI0036AC3D36